SAVSVVISATPAASDDWSRLSIRRAAVAVNVSKILTEPTGAPTCPGGGWPPPAGLPMLGSTPERAVSRRKELMTTAMDLSNAMAGAVERAAASIVAVHGRPRLPSTGVHWRAGLIVTANHTVEAEREVALTDADERTLSAQVVGRDPSLDIAVLRAEVG